MFLSSVKWAEQAARTRHSCSKDERRGPLSDRADKIFSQAVPRRTTERRMRVKKSGRGKILRRKAEIEHFPFAVAVGRQHGIGLAGRSARIAPCISNGPFMEALASIRIGSAASLPSGVINTRSLTLTSSAPDSEAGSFEQVLRCRRNAAISVLAISAASVAGASKLSSPLLRACAGAGGSGERSGGRPSNT